MENKKFKIIFYKDNKGKSPVKDYMDSLNKTINTNKDSCIKLAKIVEYLDILSIKGLLTHFVKKTQETPEAEKDKAEKTMKKFLKENREQ